ncbi:MAG: ABC transporter permease [Firmicutes bacterium]|nr:ABC transporter permease [Candidatus Fermentithermobacillaceae bacterium]
MRASVKHMDIYLLLAIRGVKMRPFQMVSISLVVASTAVMAAMVLGYTGTVVEATVARVRPASLGCDDVCGLVPSRSQFAGQSLARDACRAALGGWRNVLAFLPVLGAAAITCLLTASLLGRKRTLGVMRAVGGTTRELQKLLLFEAFLTGGPGIPLGLAAGQVFSKLVWGTWVLSLPAILASAGIALGAVFLGSLLPLLFLKNATTDQLLMNKPVYVIPNPSCAKCGACGGL